MLLIQLIDPAYDAIHPDFKIYIFTRTSTACKKNKVSPILKLTRNKVKDIISQVRIKSGTFLWVFTIMLSSSI